MSGRAHGQIRRSQAITTFGPGAIIDLPNFSAIVGGLDCWPPTSKLDEVVEPRLSAKLHAMTGVPRPKLYAPPKDDTPPWESGPGITVWRFPEWFVVQEADGEEQEKDLRSRRLVHNRQLQDGRFDKKRVVPTRFVQACRNGHISDISWRRFIRCPENCNHPLWLDEKGTGGDLADLTIRCGCGAQRSMSDAAAYSELPLGTCNGRMPWLGAKISETCKEPARLLIRTATNAFFSQVVSALSLPEVKGDLENIIEQHLGDLDKVKDADGFDRFKEFASDELLAKLEPFSAAEIVKELETQRKGAKDTRPVKHAELDAILSAPEGFGEDIQKDSDFYARILPEKIWRRGKNGVADGIASVIQLHRLREVMAMIGFTRFEAVMPDINGDYGDEVSPADIAQEPSWFPAIENRGEGIFVQLKATAMKTWMKRPAVTQRIEGLAGGQKKWNENRKRDRDFVGGPYVLLHTLSHLMVQSLSMTCGYPVSSIRERIYVDGSRYGFLLYTGTPDAEGTLGGLVQEARAIERHLENALRMASLCSNDPICANHEAGESHETRFLQGAACHGCCLIPETSCEMRNDYLDRALVVPILGEADAAFFPELG